MRSQRSFTVKPLIRSGHGRETLQEELASNLTLLRALRLELRSAMKHPNEWKKTSAVVIIRAT